MKIIIFDCLKQNIVESYHFVQTKKKLGEKGDGKRHYYQIFKVPSTGGRSLVAYSFENCALEPIN